MAGAELEVRTLPISKHARVYFEAVRTGAAVLTLVLNVVILVKVL